MNRRIENLALFTAQSLGASVNSAAFATTDCSQFFIQLIVTASSSPVGTLVVQTTLDMVPTSTSVWSDVTPILNVSANDNFLIPIADWSAPFMRVKYTRTSGSATLDGRVHFNGY